MPGKYSRCRERFREHIHSLACRHCNGFEIPAFNAISGAVAPTSYAGKLLLGDNELQREIASIETHPDLYTEISNFCERCHRVSVIPFEYASEIDSSMSHMFSGPVHSGTQRLGPSYGDACAYYVAMVRKFRLMAPPTSVS
eukprot:3613838-Rhodomonas_salina.2